MFRKFKFFAFALGLAAGATGFVACKNDNLQAPSTPRQELSNESAYQRLPEIPDEDGFGGAARSAAADPNSVYQILKVTGQYSTTGTNSAAALAVYNGSVTSPTLSATAVTSANGYKKFSVKAEQFNTFLKRKVDKSSAQTYFMLDRDAKTYKRCGQVSANGSTFDFLPTYLKNGIAIGAGTLSSAGLQ